MPVIEKWVDSTPAVPQQQAPIRTQTVVTREPKREYIPRNVDQAPPVKAQPAAESAPTAESVKLSPQLSALARKEREVREREHAIKLKEKEIEDRLNGSKQFDDIKSSIQAKDFSKAEELGLSYEDYTQYLLQKQQTEDPQSQALKEIKAEIDSIKKGQEESAAKQYEATVAEYKEEISSLVDKDERFRSIKKLDRQDAVLQLILDSWEEDGSELSIEEAAKDVENYLVEHAKKMAALLETPGTETASLPQKATLPPPRVTSKTLTQNIAAVGTEPIRHKSLHQMSDHERYAEAFRRVMARKEQGK